MSTYYIYNNSQNTTQLKIEFPSSRSAKLSMGILEKKVFFFLCALQTNPPEFYLQH